MKTFLSLPVVWVFLTLAIYFLAQGLHKKVKWALTTPILVTIFVLILLLSVFDMDFGTYDSGGKFLSFFLGPSVVALGVLFYEKLDEIKSNLFPFCIAVFVGGIGSILSLIFILMALKAPEVLMRSLAPKSVTTPIAIEIAKSVGGVPSITAGIVIAVGIFGNAFGIYILKFLGITSKTAIGTALGTASHGIGTARALEESELSGVYSGLALCVNGLVTAIVTPLVIDWIFA